MGGNMSNVLPVEAVKLNVKSCWSLKLILRLETNKRTYLWLTPAVKFQSKGKFHYTDRGE